MEKVGILRLFTHSEFEHMYTVEPQFMVTSLVLCQGANAIKVTLTQSQIFCHCEKKQDASLGNMVASVLRLLLASPAGDRKGEVAV